MAERTRWISFVDFETGLEAGVGIREVEGAVAVVISHKDDGDLVTHLPRTAVRELLAALTSLVDEGAGS